MGVSAFAGPAVVYGTMPYIPASFGDPVPEYNPDAGPGITFQGDGIPDVRFPYPKDKVAGYPGSVPSNINLAYLQSVDQIPSTFGTATIASLQTIASGTAFVLNNATTTGASGNVAVGIPYLPQNTALTAPNLVLNGTPPQSTGLMLEFGFAFGNVTSGNKVITVADPTQFWQGMPIIIADVGAAAAGTPLVTFVTQTSGLGGTTITVNDAPLRSANPTPIGAGNVWLGSENQSSAAGFYSNGHLPYLAGGPGLWLDPSQAMARGVSITAAASATATSVTVRGYDMYFQPQTEQIGVTAGATTYGKKTWKVVTGANLNAADAAHQYSIGTSDIFGFALRSDKWEYTNVFWAGGFMTASQGWVAGDRTTPALATTGDVRGTVQTSAIGGTSGGGIGANSSNGSVVSLAMSGRRLAIFQSMPLLNMIQGFPQSPYWMFGNTPA